MIICIYLLMMYWCILYTLLHFSPFWYIDISIILITNLLSVGTLQKETMGHKSYSRHYFRMHVCPFICVKYGMLLVWVFT